MTLTEEKRNSSTRMRLFKPLLNTVCLREKPQPGSKRMVSTNCLQQSRATF